MAESQVFTRQDEEALVLSLQVPRPVSSLPQLTTLRIHRDISGDLLEATLRHTKHSLQDLEVWKMNSLSLSGTNGMSNFCSALHQHPCLQKVLFNTAEAMSDAHVVDLFKALTTCSRLKSLLLYRSARRGFGEDDSAALPLELCSMPQLETLVTDLKFRLHTAQQVFRCLHSNTTLKRLRMGLLPNHDDDDDGTPALVEMLEHNDVLESVDMEGIAQSTRQTIEFYLLLNFLGRRELRKRSTAKLLDFIIANHHNPKVVFFFLSRHPNIIVQNAGTGIATSTTVRL